MNNKKIFIIPMMIAWFAASAMADTERATYTISDAVSEAIARNPVINEADALTQSAGEAVKKARADMFAKASMTYSYTGLGETPVMKQGDVEIQVAHTNQYHWDVTLAQPLFTGFALTTQLKLSNLGLAASVIEREMSVLDLARDVKSACYQLLLIQKMLMVADEEVESLESHRDEARQFYGQGLIPRNDLLKSEVALSSVIQEREKTRASVKNAKALVNMLLDADLNRSITIRDITDIPEHVGFQYDQLFFEAKKKRPEIVLLRNNQRRAELGQTLAKSAYYPKISAVGRYERTGDDPGMSENDYNNESNSSLTLEAQWTFFEWGKTRADVRRSGYEKKALTETIRTVENSIGLEVNNALLSLNVAAKNIRTAQDSLGQAKENWRITKVQYAEQVATSTDVLDARAFLSRADMNYYGALYGYMIYLAELDRALGRRT